MPPFFKGKKLDWIHRKNIKQYLDQYDEKKLNLSEVGEKIEAELKDLILINDGDALYTRIENLKDACYDNDIEWFDSCLEELYIWADQNLVWLGI
jgi:hypothetical protein